MFVTVALTWLSLSLDFADCIIGARTDSARVGADCATLELPEGRISGSGRKLSIHVARLPSSSKTKTPPVFFLAGGPGQAASEAFAPLAPVFDRVNQHHDIVLVDQRGTGRSAKLTCRAGFPPNGADGDEARKLSALKQCAAELAIDVRDYGTDAYVADLEAVREQLNVPQVLLYGVSYGTRVAQRYITLHQDKVAGAILDGVVPAGSSIAVGLEDKAKSSVDGTFKRCSANPSCQAAMGSDVLAQAKKRLPLTVVVAHPTTGQKQTVVLSADVVDEALRMAAYTNETAAMMPFALHALALGDGAPLAAFVVLAQESLLHSLSRELNLSVLCGEDLAVLFDKAKPQSADLAAQHLWKECQAWTEQRAGAGAGALDLAENDVPMWLISGELDPITPPVGAESVLARSRQAKHFVQKGQGHGSIARGCWPKLAARFFNAKTPTERAAIDTTCTERIAPAPFLLNTTGIEP